MCLTVLGSEGAHRLDPPSYSPSSPCAGFLAAVADAAEAWGDAELAAEALELCEELSDSDDDDEEAAEGARQREGGEEPARHDGGGGGLFSSLASAVGAWWS